MTSATIFVTKNGTKIGEHMNRRPFLTVEDVMRIWGQERARAQGKDPQNAEPVSRATVLRYIQANPGGAGKRPSRYAHNPPPAATHITAKSLIWLPAENETVAGLELRLRQWWRSRDGQGAGGGRKPSVTKSAAQLAKILDIQPSQLRAGIATGLIQPADADGRWSAALAVELLESIKNVRSKLPPARRAVKRTV